MENLPEWQQTADINLYNLTTKTTRFCDHGFNTGEKEIIGTIPITNSLIESGRTFILKAKFTKNYLNR
jgi:hypothetical protein